jgi:uncharacterized protein (TIGR02145 family)
MYYVQQDGYYWSSTEDSSDTRYAYYLGFSGSYLAVSSSSIKDVGFQVRCVR